MRSMTPIKLALAGLLLAGMPLIASPELSDLLRPLSSTIQARPTSPHHQDVSEDVQKRERLSPSVLVEELRQALNLHLNVEGELRLRPVRPLPAVVVFVDDWEIELVAPPPTLPGTRLTLEWVVRTGKGLTSQFRHPFYVEVWEDAWVVKQRLRRGDPVSESSVERAPLNTLGERNKPILASVSLDNLEATSAIMEGRPLTWRDVQSRPAIRRGDTVDVILEQGTLSITMVAEAIQNGQIGDTITLRNLQTRREIQAVVAGPGRARLELSPNASN